LEAIEEGKKLRPLKLAHVMPNFRMLWTSCLFDFFTSDQEGNQSNT